MRSFSVKQIIYFVLAIFGAILPWYYNLQFMAESGNSGQFDLAGFIAGGFANAAASSLTIDLSIIVVAFIIWMVSESIKLGMRYWWVYLVLTGLVAAAFSFPLFLFMRERKLRWLEQDS